MTHPSAEQFSTAFFRNKHQLAVLAELARCDPEEWVWAREISDRSGVRDNQVGPLLRRLTEAGLLAQVTNPTGGGQKAYFIREPSPVWTMVNELMKDLRPSGTPDREMPKR